MAFRLSFSTCWNSARHRDGEGVLREILELGFDTVELGHGTPVTHIPDILAFQSRGDIRISSLHNFCPVPLEVGGNSPDCYEFTSHRPTDRSRALLLTKRTLDLAAQVRAETVVLHLGMARNIQVSRELETMLEQGKLHSKDYARKKVAAVQAREKSAALYLPRVREALDELVPYAAERKIRLGFENRNQYEGFPSERELPALLEAYSPTAGYWHDFGHAQIKHNLALLHHHQWLEKTGPAAIGAHLHDLQWPLRDHRVPLSGEIPYAELLPFFPAGIPLVWELSPKTEADEIRRALAAWKGIFGP